MSRDCSFNFNRIKISKNVVPDYIQVYHPEAPSLSALMCGGCSWGSGLNTQLLKSGQPVTKLHFTSTIEALCQAGKDCTVYSTRVASHWPVPNSHFSSTVEALYEKGKDFTVSCTWPQVSGVCSGVCVAIVFLCNVRAVNKQTSMYIAHPNHTLYLSFFLH